MSPYVPELRLETKIPGGMVSTIGDPSEGYETAVFSDEKWPHVLAVDRLEVKEYETEALARVGHVSVSEAWEAGVGPLVDLIKHAEGEIVEGYQCGEDLTLNLLAGLYHARVLGEPTKHPQGEAMGAWFDDKPHQVLNRLICIAVRSLRKKQ